jgi:hypothetical protein
MLPPWGRSPQTPFRFASSLTADQKRVACALHNPTARVGERDAQKTSKLVAYNTEPNVNLGIN